MYLPSSFTIDACSKISHLRNFSIRSHFSIFDPAGDFPRMDVGNFINNYTVSEKTVNIPFQSQTRV